MSEWTPLLVTLMAFGSVAAIVYVAARYLTSQASMHRRLPIHAAGSSSGVTEDIVPNYFLASLTKNLEA